MRSPTHSKHCPLFFWRALRRSQYQFPAPPSPFCRVLYKAPTPTPSTPSSDARHSAGVPTHPKHSNLLRCRAPEWNPHPLQTKTPLLMWDIRRQSPPRSPPQPLPRKDMRSRQRQKLWACQRSTQNKDIWLDSKTNINGGLIQIGTTGESEDEHGRLTRESLQVDDIIDDSTTRNLRLARA